jgi:hypothetical protein
MEEGTASPTKVGAEHVRRICVQRLYRATILAAVCQYLIQEDINLTYTSSTTRSISLPNLHAHPTTRNLTRHLPPPPILDHPPSPPLPRNQLTPKVLFKFLPSVPQSHLDLFATTLATLKNLPSVKDNRLIVGGPSITEPAERSKGFQYALLSYHKDREALEEYQASDRHHE